MEHIQLAVTTESRCLEKIIQRNVKFDKRQINCKIISTHKQVFKYTVFPIIFIQNVCMQGAVKTKESQSIFSKYSYGTISYLN